MASCIDLAGRIRHKKILLKPNLISAVAPHIACTHPVFIAETARWLLDHGAAQVSVGDSPAYGSAASAMKRHGILKQLSGLGVKTVEFSAGREISLTDGTKVKIGRAACECDLLINLPKVKAHGQMFVTLAVKNLFGVVKGHKKAILHISHGDSTQIFSQMLFEIIAALPPHISLIDGIYAMHKQGPLKGEAMQLGLVGACENPVALDMALMDVLQLEPSQSPLLKFAMASHIAGSDAAELSYPLAKPAEFHGSGFLPPKGLKPISFHPAKLIYGQMKRLFHKIIS